jgi:hypothetical protein
VISARAITKKQIRNNKIGAVKELRMAYTYHYSYYAK